MATLQDVARRANVSLSTASRILAEVPDKRFSYSEATRERVLRASLELGYKPNLAAHALASGRTNILAAVFPRVYDTPFTALASLQILASLEEACSRRGYHLLISSPALDAPDAEAGLRNLLDGRYVDAVIFDRHFASDPIASLVRAYNVPMLALGYAEDACFVRSDGFTSGRLLLQHLVSLGHRNIGVIAVADGVHLGVDECLKGLQAAAVECGLDAGAFPRLDGTLSRQSGYEAALGLLQEHPELTALIALNDRMAMGAIQAAHELGRRVPDDLSVVGHNNLPQAAEFSPGLTTINQRLEQWGEIAVDIVVRMLNREPANSVILPVELIVRESSGPPPER